MKPLSQLPSEEALRQLKESGLGMAQERYRALKLLGSAGDAEVDSLGESMIQINLQNPALKK